MGVMLGGAAWLLFAVSVAALAGFVALLLQQVALEQERRAKVRYLPLPGVQNPAVALPARRAPQRTRRAS